MTVIRTDDIETCQNIRRVVFMQEQNVSETDEIDGRDGEAVHFLIHVDERPVGTARAFVSDGTIKIGRVCVLKEGRGSGLGVALMQGVMEWARAEGVHKAKLDAQTSVVPFYEGLGFVASGPEFDDAGIPHRYMERNL